MSAFTPDQVVAFVAHARAPWGVGWKLLSLPIRKAFLEAEALRVVMTQIQPEIAVQAIRAGRARETTSGEPNCAKCLRIQQAMV